MTEQFLTPLQQWLLFMGVTFGLGCVAWRAVVAPNAIRMTAGAGAAGAARVERGTARAGVVTGLVLLVAWVLRMVNQVILFRDPFVPLSEDVSFLLFETFWGTVWMAQGVIIPLLTVSFWRAAARSGRGRDVPEGEVGKVSPPWVAATVMMILLAVSLALSSHAMSADAWRPLAVTADAVHLLAAGAWIGALSVILTIGRPASGEGYGRELFAAQIRAFSPMAVVSVAALVSMGVVLSWTHLTALSDLWTITYGRLLSAKLIVAAGVLGAGFVNWRRGIPDLGTDAGVRTIWRRASFEVILAMGVLLLTAVLVHSAKP